VDHLEASVHPALRVRWAVQVFQVPLEYRAHQVELDQLVHLAPLEEQDLKELAEQPDRKVVLVHRVQPVRQAMLGRLDLLDPAVLLALKDPVVRLDLQDLAVLWDQSELWGLQVLMVDRDRRDHRDCQDRLEVRALRVLTASLEWLVQPDLPAPVDRQARPE